MGDLQFWLYVIIGVIYLLSRVMKKQSPKTPADLPETRPDKPVARFDTPPAKPRAPAKTLSFEELLREITESKMPQKPAPPEEEYVNYDDDLKDEVQDLEDVNYDYKKDKIAREYATTEQQAFLRPSLEETMRLENTDTTFEKFKVFEQQIQSNPMDRYLADFYDPDGLKKAIIMSEILQRKF